MKIKCLECECGLRFTADEDFDDDMICDWVRYGMDGSKEVYKKTITCPYCESDNFSIVVYEKEFN